MKNALQYSVAIILASMLFMSQLKAQCNWQEKLNDGFEYSTVIPDIIPGTTVHNTPQTFAVHNGLKSVYLNFLNTLPAGSLVYDRTITVCPNVAIQLSAWLTTTFSGTQCDMRIEITDGNSVQLSNVASIVAPYAPVWIQYQSGIITPTTNTIRLKMYANSAGSSGGNDLSFDDLEMEQCSMINLGADSIKCNTSTITLNAGNGYATYAWSNGDTTQFVSASTTLPGSVVLNYNVIVTDTNGCVFGDTIQIIFVPCNALNEMNSANDIIATPNPTNGVITININIDLKHIELCDIYGKIIRSFSNAKIINLDDLPKGIYLLQFEKMNGERVFQRIVLQ
ncbi:MAG: T9SS type A sorting domain-containing protein [Bacteroidetes bacterium]|nr:T9SS type A sorting domain-containing protein [Bacteroidota bacterium]